MQVAESLHRLHVGDLTDVRESKRADALRQQARVVIANITAQIEGRNPTPTTFHEEWVILPLGPNMGASQLLDSDGQTRWVPIRRRKSKTHGVRYRSQPA